MKKFPLDAGFICGVTLCLGLGSPVLASTTATITAGVASAPAQVSASKAKLALADTPAHVLRNVAYGPDARHRFDAYIPAKPSGPVMFLVGGVDWAKGDKAAHDLMSRKVKHWSQRGVVVVSTNYRLIPKASPLAQATDVAKALAKAQALATAWGADPARFVLMGHSSGAHLVTLLNTAPMLAKQQGAKPWRAAVSIDATAFDVEALMTAPHAALYDRAFGKKVEDWRAASPYHALAEKTVPPILFLCSKLQGDACAQALHFERKASKLHHRIVIWEQFLNHRDMIRKLGDDATYTDMVDIWLRSVM